MNKKSNEKKKKHVIPARIVIEIDEKGNEFAYEWKGDALGWLNLTTEAYYTNDHVQEFLELYVERVDFGNVSTITGQEWRDQGCPRELKLDIDVEVNA